MFTTFKDIVFKLRQYLTTNQVCQDDDRTGERNQKQHK